jgi:chromosome segregation ATPase
MADDDDLERTVRKLAVEHAETRWLALRLDDDVKEMRHDLRAVRATQDEHTALLAEHTALLAEHSTKLTEHTGRFDSVDAQLRSLTQMVGQVLDRLPGEPGDAAT